MLQASTSFLLTILCLGLKFEPTACQATEIDKDASSNAIAQLSLDMERNFRKGDENQFFSAISLSTAMAMLHAGAKGKSESEISRALYFTNISVKDVYKFYAEMYKSGAAGNYTLHLANRLFGQRGMSISPMYLTILNNFFLSPLQFVDFEDAPIEAAKIINNFVDNATLGTIPKLLPETIFVGTTTVLAIVNAVYFKGFWVYKFNSSFTRMESFTTSNGQKIFTPIMNQLATFHYAQSAALDCKILQLQYKGGDISMTIILPNKINRIVDLLNKITSNDLVNYSNKAYFMETTVDVKLPKFKFEQTYEKILKQFLKDQGINDAFDVNKSNLTGIATTDPRLVVGKIIQKAVIEVDEEGSKSAAATFMQVCRAACRASASQLPKEPKYFYATHPFFFFISDSRTNTILFSGTFMKPN